MSAKIPYDKRMLQIEELSKNYRNIREFYKYHPYLYKWALRHDVDLKKFFPQKLIHCTYGERMNKGIDCYDAKTMKLHKHYAFIVDAMRDLDLTYHYVYKVLDGEIPSINGYFFVRCN
jgi:hypothetical protein